MDLLTALGLATDEFCRRLDSVGAAQWSSSTPCDEWDVHYLVAHVVGGNRFTRLVLDGRRADDAIAEVMSSPQLGADPMRAWSVTVAQQAEAFRRPGALDALVDHPLGSITGGDLLGFRLFDITLHAWDLATAIGADDSLPVDLVEDVIAIVEAGPPGMGFGIRTVPTAATASRQAQLLAMAGRGA